MFLQEVKTYLEDPHAHVPGDGVIRKAQAPAGSAETYFAGDELARATGLLENPRARRPVVDEASVPATMDRSLALRMYRGMVRIRIMDERLMALQRQGRIGFYGEARGQEAGHRRLGGGAGRGRLDRCRRSARRAQACMPGCRSASTWPSSTAT